ncbi:cryptochrome/photolyase family protein [Solimonas marina]|uniref:Deoxyribodipyrimidine photo-lyase n=1 Tax=Solimonas marina TaxID=2714601 RepID=A0A970B6S5_9GAMM|nr:deoxyribodipyrimidine photo-lyase [Solimonas marina]NKF22910.1 deoxyribodipyrimidine photo-lyase [Solimonas marina]
MTTRPPAIVWFRRDLRLTDNPTLAAALAAHDTVVPVYIDDPDSEAPWTPGGATRWWLHHSLAALDERLRATGARLLLRRGDSLTALRALIAETGADAVYWSRLYEPATIARDRDIKQALREDGVEVHSHNAALWCEPWTLKTGAGDPYRVFTPFWRALQPQMPALHIHRAPQSIPVPKRMPDSLALQALGLRPKIAWDLGMQATWTPGETGALTAAADFAKASLGNYREGRDFPARADTTRLSPHLHFGEISPQQVRAAVQRHAAGQARLEDDASHVLRELGWREFAHHLLFHYPQTPEAPLYEKFAKLPWRQPRDYAADLAAWQQGRTGVPIVDAGMRELWTTGWMHNRVRMIVASFLTKNLLIPWQEGARWFWDTLLDADLANNTLGWQWTAGCGADAAPYFRVFNPVLQAGKFDAEAAYIRSWVPELSALPPDAAHAPWQAKPAILAAARLRLGTDYPLPIVDLAASRQRALDAYQAIKAG